MTFDTFGAVILTLVFLVPGFIYASVLRWFTVPVARNIAHENLGRFTFSCWNFAIWSWQIIRIYTLEWEGSIAVLVWFLIIIFVSPIICGFAIGWIINQDFYQEIVKKIPKKHIYSPPTAWDHVWNNSIYGWVGILLRDGSRVYGYWDFDSEASWDVDHRDIYLSTAYEVSEDGEWRRVPRTGGVLINGDDIVTVHLWEEVQKDKE